MKRRANRLTLSKVQPTSHVTENWQALALRHQGNDLFLASVLQLHQISGVRCLKFRKLCANSTKYLEFNQTSANFHNSSGWPRSPKPSMAAFAILWLCSATLLPLQTKSVHNHKFVITFVLNLLTRIKTLLNADGLEPSPSSTG